MTEDDADDDGRDVADDGMSNLTAVIILGILLMFAWGYFSGVDTAYITEQYYEMRGIEHEMHKGSLKYAIHYAHPERACYSKYYRRLYTKDELSLYEAWCSANNKPEPHTRRFFDPSNNDRWGLADAMDAWYRLKDSGLLQKSVK